MRGYITGIVCGLLALLLWPNHLFLSIMVALVVPAVVLAFWTGTVGVRFEKS